METDNNKQFENLVDKIFHRKWQELMKQGSFVTNITADQIRRVAIKEAEQEFKDNDSKRRY